MSGTGDQAGDNQGNHAQVGNDPERRGGQPNNDGNPVVPETPPEEANPARSIDALTEEVRGYRAEQNKSDPKKLAIDRIAAAAAIIALIVSAGNLVAYYCLTREANETAGRALQISASQLQMAQIDERPWLKVDITPESDFVFGQSQDGAKVAGMNVRVTVTNTGKTPAMFVTPRIDMHEGRLKRAGIGADQAALCRPFAPKSADIVSYTMFPGQTNFFVYDLAISQSELVASRAFSAQFPKLPQGVTPVAIGCVGYKTGIDEGWHQTNFAEAFVERAAAVLDPSKGTVKKANLIPLPFTLAPNGFFAD